MPNPLVFTDIINGGWESLTFEPFREGIEICHLVTGEPAVALLRYQPGATVPRHQHSGLETILVLQGSQRDEFGTYGVGTLVINQVGSRHAVAADDGCVVLVQWAKPVEFVKAKE